MLRELAVNTRVIYYLMALLGIIGVLAKAVNQQTLNQICLLYTSDAADE